MGRCGRLVLGLGVAGIYGCGQGAPAATPAGAGLGAHPDGRAWVGTAGALALRVEGGIVALAPPGSGPVTLETEGGSIGEPESLDEGRALVVHRAGVDERWETRDGAAEQSWVFARRPPGEVAVRVRVTGLRYAATDEGGLHLRDARTGAPWRYSHATWVDARGERTAVPAAWDDGAVVIRVPADVAARSAYPAVLDPTVGPEALLDATVHSWRVITRSDFRPSATWVGSSYALAVQGDQYFRTDQSILLARANADGTPIDPGGAWVDQYADGVSRTAIFPAIWSDGAGGALVTWEVIGSGLWAARVDATGALARPTQVDPGAAFNPYNADARWRLAFAGDGGQFVSVLPVDAAGSAYALRLHRPDGTYATATPLASLGALGPIARPQVAVAASGYLVAWQTSSAATGSDVRFARVSRAGAVLDPAGAPLTIAAASRHDVRLATDGTRWFATWTADTGSGSRAPGIYWVLLGADGNPVGAAVNYAGPGTLAAAAFNGTNFLLAWREGTFINTARVSPAGVRLDATAARWDALRDGDLAVSAHGGDFLVTTNIGYLVGRAVSGANVPLGAQTFAAHVDAHDSGGALCFDGTQYRATWERHELAGGFNDLLAARLSPAGVLLDAPATLVSSVPGYNWEFVGSVACTRTSLMGGASVGRFMTFGAGGAVTTGRTTGITAPTYAVAAAPYGFALLGRSPTGTPAPLAVTRVSADGAALDAFPIVLGAYSVTSTDTSLVGAIDFDGVNNAALWRGRVPSGLAPLRFTRISPEGDVFTPGGVEVALPAVPNQAYPGSAPPSLTGGPSQHLMVWIAYASCGGTSVCPTLTAARLSTTGAVLGGALQLATFAAEAQLPAVVTAWDGREYLVAWSDPNQRGNLRAARVLTDGSLPDPGGFAITTGLDIKDRPMMASAGDGTALVGYRQHAPALAALRYFTRVVRPGDATPDGGVDAGMVADVPRDVGTDSGTDAGVVVVVDAGVVPPVDAPALDAGPVTDAASVDTGTTGPTDAGTVDEGTTTPVDAGSTDVGTTPTDVGSTDAGTTPTDVGTTTPTDVGTTPPTDAGATPPTDAGAATDAAAPSTDAGPPDDGGSCTASPRAPSRAGSSLAVFALAAALSRRRRRAAA